MKEKKLYLVTKENGLNEVTEEDFSEWYKKNIDVDVPDVSYENHEVYYEQNGKLYILDIFEVDNIIVLCHKNTPEFVIPT